jgi:hypothetical protein
VRVSAVTAVFPTAAESRTKKKEDRRKKEQDCTQDGAGEKKKRNVLIYKVRRTRKTKEIEVKYSKHLLRHFSSLCCVFYL